MGKTRGTRAALRATALGVAAGTLVVAAAGTAGAAGTVQRYTSTAGGSALDLIVYLPVDVPGLTVNHKLDLSISLTNGTATLNGATRLIDTGADLTTTTSSVLGGVLNKQTSASGSDASQQTSIVGPESLPAGLGTVALGPVSSRTGSLTGTGLVAQSSSTLASLDLVPTGLPALSSVTKTLTSTVSQALGSASGGASSGAATLTSAVNGAINQLNSASQGAAAPVVQTVHTVESTLTSALSGVQSTLSSLSSAPALVTMTSVIQNHAITRAGNAVTAASAAGVGSLNVLGGLVSLTGLQSAVRATAGGVPGSASVTFPAQPLIRLSVANNALTFLIDGSGLHLQGDLSALPPALQNTVNGALGDLTSLLNQVAGVSVTYGKGTSSVSPDGTSASGQVSPTALTINPSVLKPLLPAGAPYFMRIEFVPVHAAVSNQLVAAGATTAVVSVNHTLAFTGADLPLSGGVATVLLGLGLVVLRRRRSLS